MRKIACILLIGLLSMSLFAFGAQYINVGVATQDTSSGSGLIELMTEYDISSHKGFKYGGLTAVDALIGDAFNVAIEIGPFLKMEFSNGSELLTGITFGIDWEDIKDSTINFRFQDEFKFKKGIKAVVGCEIGARFSDESSTGKVFAGIVYNF